MVLSETLLKRLPIMLSPLAVLLYTLNVELVLPPSLTGKLKSEEKKYDGARRFIVTPNQDRGLEPFQTCIVLSL